ncbi:MAG: hypothetical protein K2I35_01965 [Duncaniella sp.]|nr:hypothetical protein [Duncaniella sp.]
MKFEINKKNRSFTISGITPEQMGVLCFLVNTAKDYTSSMVAKKMLEEDGFVDLGNIGVVSFEKEEVEILSKMPQF